MRATHPLALLVSVSIPLCSSSPLVQRDLVAPTIGDGSQWEYKGCYHDQVGRLLKGKSTASQTMSNTECANYCLAAGFPVAGTQWFTECWCGLELPATAKKTDSELACDTQCAGAPTEPCGGGFKLTIFQASASVPQTGPQVNPGPGEWNSLGCWSEGVGGRALVHPKVMPGNQMTVEKCVTACEASGFILAGLEYGGECFCGNDIMNNGEVATSGCSMPCNGLKSELCGGPNRLNVYDFKAQWAVANGFNVPPTSSSQPVPVISTSAPVIQDSSTEAAVITSSSVLVVEEPSGPHHPKRIGAWSFMGCFTDNVGGARALKGSFLGGNTVSLDSCSSFCESKGFTYAGAEYSGECFCGNTISAGNTLVPEEECKMICKANPLQLCGDGNRLSLYKLGPVQESSSEVIAQTTTSSPSSSSSLVSTLASTSDTTLPTEVVLPADWTNQGCWVDGVTGRILSTQLADSPQGNTNMDCASRCALAGFTMSGTQYTAQCFCSDGHVVNSGVLAQSDAECNTPCSGDKTEMCGGPDRMTIYSSSPPNAPGTPTPDAGGEVTGTWTYMGCAMDNVNDKRTFAWQLYFPGIMTAEMCLSRCGSFGYHAAGLEYGQECYCGDPANMATMGSTFVAEAQCDVPCVGDPTTICGGGSRLSTYFWTGAPLYEWDFPTGAQAGQYSMLIGGVIIPLMTMESITGKVTFLEKSGTGAPNATGVYELDLSLTNDFANAWREMHVKTDIFCSGGIVLPDKAGRQLTVGGWSGDSTYGVRLYSPDGSPGVPGQNDWEENVNILKLQDGRWYPTVMMMANGSVLVIGGEEGSNGKAVPTLEILPYTGGAPIRMPWLERTDPNNLYPFTAVLPSGGIFVAYWNEARVLDEQTFADRKVLPNIPGAVNDPLGGRTYPLEGTGVLLPQRGPNYDDLGILICGGSTVGVSTALDNCVTIYPDEAQPEWTIERMPSARVMSCMAPLPDGTYLILNGALHGVAGFGLATGPNLNAVLYNPVKPSGKRMSIMANTTIARMYHSEAITLLDGRVLVSGSDPEDGVNPQEYRVEVFTPPYLLTGRVRPTFVLAEKDWAYGATVTFQLGAAPEGLLAVSLLGAVSSTHGNSMGARTLLPQVNCAGITCTFTVPDTANKCPPGWYQFFVLDDGIPAVGVYVRIGGDPAGLGNWPVGDGFNPPGMGGLI